MILGPRTGKYISINGKVSVKAIPGHNIPLAALGVFILWFGWFGFNPGSTTAGTDLSIATIAVTTNLAAAAGAVSALFYSWIRFGKPDPSMALNGTLAGLVAITAGCAFVSPLSAIIIGLAAGVLVVFVWVFSTCHGLFLILKKTVGLRVKPEEEIRGLDIGEHGIESYCGFQVFTTQ